MGVWLKPKLPRQVVDSEAVARVKLLYITDSFPFGPREVFFHPEVAALRRAGVDLKLWPIAGRSEVFHPRGEVLLPILGDEGNAWRRPLAAVARHMRFLLTHLESPAASKPAMARLKTAVKNHLAVGRALACMDGMGCWRPDHIHAQWANYTATAAWQLAGWLGLPWSFTAHRYDIVCDNLFARKARAAAFVRFISQSGMGLAREMGLIDGSSRCHVSHMGVDELASAPVEVPHREEVVAVVPANLVPVKGHDTLLDAIGLADEKCRSRLRVLLAGEGELRGRLEERLRRDTRLARVEMAGQMPHGALMSMYGEGKVDMVVLPSLDLGGGHHEGVPISLMEAMGRGLPVISTRTGGIPELVTDACGRLVAHGDARELASALEEFTASHSLRRACGINGFLRVRKQFTGEASAARLMNQLEAAASSFQTGMKIGAPTPDV